MTNEQLKETSAGLLAAANGQPWECLSTEGEEGNRCFWGTCTSMSPLELIKEGYRLRPKPAPKTRPWSKRSDVPSEPSLWLRLTTQLQHDFETLILTIGDAGVRSIDENSKPHFFNWQTLSLTGAQYSTDRKTWAKCEVTEE